MSYGYTTNPGGYDPLVDLADEVMAEIFSSACVYGNWTVDMLPFCAFILKSMIGTLAYDR